MIILYVLLGVIALVFITTFIIYRMAFYNSAKNMENYSFPIAEDYAPLAEKADVLIDKLKSAPCEDVYINANGLKLHARYYKINDGNKLDVGVHGYKSAAIRDFCGGAQTAFKLGHNLLLIDQRAHGQSEGNTISFGINEKYDVLAWINYAIERFGEDVSINLYGISMGAATVLMASGLDLPKNVVRILADSPYDKPKDVIESTIKGMGLPVKPLYPFVRLSGIIFGGFDIEKHACSEEVKTSTVPTVIMHGLADKIVPVQMSEKIANANPIIRRYTFPDSGHVMAYLIHEEEYANIADEFLDT